MLVILLPTACLLLLALQEVRHAHLNAVANTDRRLRRWFSAAVGAAVLTAVVLVLTAIGFLGLSLVTAYAAGVGVLRLAPWSITVSRTHTHRNLQIGVFGAAVVTALWSVTLAVGPVSVGTEVGNLLAWAPPISGTIALASAVVALGMITARKPRTQVLADATDR